MTYATANLVKLHTDTASYWIDTNQLASSRVVLSIYTASGKKLSLVGRTKNIRENLSSVHRDNLFATREMAVAAFKKFFNASLSGLPRTED